MMPEENIRSGFCRNAGSRLWKKVERAKGIEPSYAAWEAAVLPLNYAREYRQATPNGRRVQPQLTDRPRRGICT
jgi:hypothetical protein